MKEIALIFKNIQKSLIKIYLIFKIFKTLSCNYIYMCFSLKVGIVTYVSNKYRIVFNNKKTKKIFLNFIYKEAK